MTVGLLECDHVLPQFRHIAGDYSDMFMALLPELDWRFFDVCNGVLPDARDNCAAYICTGSKYSVYDDVPWIHALKHFVRGLRDTNKKYLGVCFGHQMLGEALGGKVDKAPAGWNVGAHDLNILTPEPWMQPPRERIRVLMMCQDQVLRLPEGAEVLAQGATCPVAMFRVGDNMLGIQGHPEFPVPYEQALMESRVERIGAEKTAAGLVSLHTPPDAGILADWVRQFLGEGG